MRSIEEVIKGITRILEKEKVDYVIVGGIAVSAWGNIRTTRDVDIILFIKEKDAGELEEALRKAKFSIQAEDIRDALKEKSHFTIFDDLSEYYIDGKGIYNENDRITLERRRKVSFADFVFYVASPEDIIANKLLFGSEQDVKDAEGIYARQFENMDMAYLEERCKRLEVYEEFLTLKRRVERSMKEYFFS
ncbi:hypothetical protein ES705_06163 [subsurface metagenome]|nr:hypothetical protein [Methanosarcinales archaeon]